MKLFIQKEMTIDDIAKNLSVSRRTLYYWKEKYNWDNKKAEKLINKDAFSKELQSFVEKLMAKITVDLQNKKAVNQSELYTLTNLLKFLPDLVKSELKQHQEMSKPTGQLSDEFIKEIEEKFLGM